jgi:hypothetical protein
MNMSKAVQSVSVDITKLGMGMKSIFSGCAMLFESLGVQGEALSQLDKLTDTAVKAQEPESTAESIPQQLQTAQADTVDFPPEEDPLPWDEAPTVEASEKKSKTSKPIVSITVDDLLKVASQKITTNRKNSPKIKALLTAYGCASISGIPEDQREAFLNDLAQL